MAFFGQADRADPEWLETLYEAARGADMAGSDYYSGVQKVSAGYPEDGDLSGEDSKAAFAASGGELESRIYRRGFLEENDLRFPENNPFFAHYFNFMTALCAHTAVKAEGVYYRRRADAAIQRNDPAAYARLEIPGQILRDCRERDIYAAKKDLIDYKYIAMQMGNIRNVCLGLFDRPDMARLAAIREEILTLCPDYADGKYYGRTLWQLRFYLDKLMQSPEEAAKAFKKDGWLELRAAIRARRGKN